MAKRAQEILDVVVNDAALCRRAKGHVMSGGEYTFIAICRVVNDVNLDFLTKGWQPFTLEEMAQAVILLHERFSEKD